MTFTRFLLPLTAVAVIGVTAAVRADTLYVSETSGQAVDKITSGGTVTRISNLSSGTSPMGLAITHAGTIYAASAGHAYLVNINAGGTTLGNYGGSHTGLAIDSSGNFFAAESGAIDEFTPAGVGSTFASGDLSGVEQIAFDFAGNLYAANATSNTIECFSPDGVGSVFATGLNRPTGLAFDASGSLFVANAGSNTILKFAAGKSTVFASGLNSPQSLAFDSGGTLYAANAGNGTVQKISKTGVASTFASGLNNPFGLAFLSSSGAPVPVPFPEPGTPSVVSMIAACCLGRRVPRR